MRLVQNSKVFDIQTDIDRQTEDFLCWCCGIGRDIFLFEAMLRQAAVQHLQQPHSSSSVRNDFSKGRVFPSISTSFLDE